ncbi:MAG: glycosyltransferase family 2 protein [Patescibacteria group bacterium]|nr:glycosyltransferase family 2 protein [Patescibacteria group bacterium]
MLEIHLSVIIPAYNEEKRIAKTLREIHKYLKTQNYNWDILVVSDGSKDNTAGVVRGLSSEIENLRLIDNKENHGKGYVVRQGLLEAKGRYKVFTDADNSTSIDQVEKMWPEFEKGFDIVIGSRDIKGAVLAVPQSRIRRITGDIFNLMVQITSGLFGIWDTQCGFKGFTKKAVENVLPKCVIDRFAFDPEILVIAKKMGYKIKEIPVTWVNDPDSRVGLKNMVKMGIDLLKIRWNLITGKYR